MPAILLRQFRLFYKGRAAGRRSTMGAGLCDRGQNASTPAITASTAGGKWKSGTHLRIRRYRRAVWGRGGDAAWAFSAR